MEFPNLTSREPPWGYNRSDMSPRSDRWVCNAAELIYIPSLQSMLEEERSHCFRWAARRARAFTKEDVIWMIKPPNQSQFFRVEGDEARRGKVVLGAHCRVSMLWCGIRHARPCDITHQIFTMQVY